MGSGTGLASPRPPGLREQPEGPRHRHPRGGKGHLGRSGIWRGGGFPSLRTAQGPLALPSRPHDRHLPWVTSSTGSC